MASTEDQLKSQVREQTGKTTQDHLSSDGLDAALSAAKRHIRVSSGLAPDDEWFTDEYPQREEALFWYTCLFVLVQTGELDSQSLQIGAIDEDELLAKDHHSVTTWYRNATQAMGAVNAGNKFGVRSMARADDREYPAHAAREYEDTAGDSAGDGFSNVQSGG